MKADIGGKKNRRRKAKKEKCECKVTYNGSLGTGGRWKKTKKMCMRFRLKGLKKE